jgi:hypothetical protein
MEYKMINIAINSVCKFRNINQLPVMVRGITNECDTAAYPRTVIFETMKGDGISVMSLPASAFLTALEPSGATAKQFKALRRMMKANELI